VYSRNTGILPVGFCGIGILPMVHGLEAHATKTPYSVTTSGCLLGLFLVDPHVVHFEPRGELRVGRVTAGGAADS
jgi:hypothetical protein